MMPYIRQEFSTSTKPSSASPDSVCLTPACNYTTVYEPSFDFQVFFSKDVVKISVRLKTLKWYSSFYNCNIPELCDVWQSLINSFLYLILDLSIFRLLNKQMSCPIIQLPNHEGKTSVISMKIAEERFDRVSHMIISDFLKTSTPFDSHGLVFIQNVWISWSHINAFDDICTKRMEEHSWTDSNMSLWACLYNIE